MICLLYSDDFLLWTFLFAGRVCLYLAFVATGITVWTGFHTMGTFPHTHDKSKPNSNLQKNDPVCSVLFTAPSFAESYFEALKIVEKINEIIQKK